MLDFVWTAATYLIPFLLVLTVVVTVHEFGHFLAGRIGFLDIVATVAETLERLDSGHDLATSAGDDVLERALRVDRTARSVAAEVLSRYGRAA